jgi:hypothetical protein
MFGESNRSLSTTLKLPSKLLKKMVLRDNTGTNFATDTDRFWDGPVAKPVKNSPSPAHRTPNPVSPTLCLFNP